MLAYVSKTVAGHQWAHEDLACSLVGGGVLRVDLVNDTATDMVVDSTMVVTERDALR